MADPSTPRLRWFSFRLRSLLIFIAVVAAPLAWVAKERRQSQHELQLADELQRFDFIEATIGGAYDSTEHTTSDAPQAWWRDLARRVLGDRVLELRIAQREFDDAAPLARLTSLRRLTLSSTQVADLRPIAGLTRLTYLNLRWAPVQDLTPLARLTKLTWLDLGFTPVADVAPLAGLDDLTSLSLDSTQVGDVRPLAKLRNLQSLNLRGTRVTDIAAIAELPKLTRLELSRSSVPPETIDAIRNALPDRKVLHSRDPTP